MLTARQLQSAWPANRPAPRAGPPALALGARTTGARRTSGTIAVSRSSSAATGGAAAGRGTRRGPPAHGRGSGPDRTPEWTPERHPEQAGHLGRLLQRALRASAGRGSCKQRRSSSLASASWAAVSGSSLGGSSLTSSSLIVRRSGASWPRLRNVSGSGTQLFFPQREKYCHNGAWPSPRVSAPWCFAQGAELPGVHHQHHGPHCGTRRKPRLQEKCPSGRGPTPLGAAMSSSAFFTAGISTATTGHGRRLLVRPRPRPAAELERRAAKRGP
jgi:hypothetical protein